MNRSDIEHRIAARSFARLLVLDGRLPLQTRLPAERELATAIAVSRTTVATSYESLRSAGVLRSRRGAGSWTQLPSGPPDDTGPAPFSPLGDSPLYDLAHAAPTAPRGPMRAAAAAAVQDLDALLAGHGHKWHALAAAPAAPAKR